MTTNYGEYLMNWLNISRQLDINKSNIKVPVDIQDADYAPVEKVSIFGEPANNRERFLKMIKEGKL